MTETLRIDTGRVLEAGERLQSIAAAIPPPPSVFRPSGADALSTAIAAKVAEVVDPVLAQLPVTKEAMQRYAQNVLSAASTYDRIDRQIAEEILERLRAFDQLTSGERGAGGTPTQGGDRSAPSAGGIPATGSAASQTGGQGSVSSAPQAGQFGQMAQVPLQLAQQAAQVPGQIAGMAAAVPGAMMQGVQAALQQAGQLSGAAGEEKQDEPSPEETNNSGEAPQTQESLVTEAAPGKTSGERAPDTSTKAAQSVTRRPGEPPETTL